MSGPRFLLAAVIVTLVPALVTTQNVRDSPGTGVRFDGLYQSDVVDKWSTGALVDMRSRAFHKDSRSYFRFYSSGDVVTKSSRLRAGQVGPLFPGFENWSLDEYQSGTYSIVNGRIVFTVARCGLCPQETAFEGDIRGEKLFLRYASSVERGLAGKRRGDFTATFVAVPLTQPPDRPSVAPALSAAALASFEGAAILAVKTPSPQQRKVLTSARTIQVVFGAASVVDFKATEQFIRRVVTAPLIDEFIRRAGLARVDRDADLLMTVDKIIIVEETVHATVSPRRLGTFLPTHRPEPLTLGTQISGRVSLTTGRDGSYVVQFAGNQRGPWFVSTTYKRFDPNKLGNTSFAEYEEKAIAGDAVMSGFGSALRTLLALFE